MSFPAATMSDKNQEIWEKFSESRMLEIMAKQSTKGEVNKKSAEGNISQYREIVALLNKYCEDWQKLTPAIIEKVKSEKPTKSTHLNGFLLCVIGRKWLKVGNDVIISILPEDYRVLAEILVENR